MSLLSQLRPLTTTITSRGMNNVMNNKSHLMFEYQNRRELSILHSLIHSSNPKPIMINEKMTLRLCPDGKTHSRQRPLAIILCWMLAKEKHIEKYREMYFTRGFDVLTCKTSPYDLLVPPNGVKVNANNLLQYLESQLISIYPDMIIHAFSVGAYMFAEVLVELINNKRYDKQLYSNFHTCLKGAIFDSIVHINECAPGLSRAMSKNVILQPVLESCINGYLKHGMATKYYWRSHEHFHGSYLSCPRMILSSKADQVSSSIENEKTRVNWERAGMSVQWKCWDDSAHVLHYHTHPKEYEEEVDKFLKRNKMDWKPESIRRVREIDVSHVASLRQQELVQLHLNQHYIL